VWVVFSLALSILWTAGALAVAMLVFHSTLVEQAEMAREWLPLTRSHWKGAEIQVAIAAAANVTDVRQILPMSKMAEKWAAHVTAA
jgi:hypothetical protein